MEILSRILMNFEEIDFFKMLVGGHYWANFLISIET